VTLYEKPDINQVGYTYPEKLMNEKTKKLASRISLTLLSIIVILFITLPVVKVINSPVSIIIKDKEMNYYRGANLFICGNTIICRIDSISAREKSKLPEEERYRYHFKLLSMNDIQSIEILHVEEGGSDEPSPVNPANLGRFKIKLQGHEGILVLGVSKDRVYGTVRFPLWGRGAVEYLKGLRISSGEVRFTRSASTADEMKRLGANYLFKQNFSGTYSSSGRVIKGFMVNDRKEKYEWEAEKR